ncbi:MAG: CvpA family protein [Acidibacillus sp.]|nr:CvpA family protein [Acidibacillus sp.]
MSEGLDIADIVIIVIIVFSAWDGYRTGFVVQVVRLLGTVLAYVLAWKFHSILTPTLARWLEGTVLKHIHHVTSSPLFVLFGTQPTRAGIAMAMGSAISFGIVFYLSLFIIRYVGHLLNVVMSLPVLSLINRFAGLVAGAVIAFVLIAVLISILSYVPVAPLKEQIMHSALAPMFQGLVRQLDKIESSL